ncbi:DUF6431 domain-containing protein [Cytobacillus sp. S13-E01]|uniref:DUF6431 domain-containing protein n=2 Tax=Cytobacillus sp. S13-E01 TaxID=3031326 RepID=UPI0031F2E8FB
MMTIILKCPIAINKYKRFVKTFNEEVFCPCCGRKTRKHGKYKKTIHFKHQSFRIPIMRRRCPDCNKTFSLMPCFAIPWGRFAIHIYEFLGRWLISGIPISQLAELLTTSSVSVVSLKTLYRWKRRFQELWGNWWIDQRKKWIAEFDGEEGVLPLYREGISSSQEIQLLLSFFFNDGAIPCKGRLLSMINLRQPIFYR